MEQEILTKQTGSVERSENPKRKKIYDGGDLKQNNPVRLCGNKRKTVG